MEMEEQKQFEMSITRAVNGTFTVFEVRTRAFSLMKVPNANTFTLNLRIYYDTMLNGRKYSK